MEVWGRVPHSVLSPKSYLTLVDCFLNLTPFESFHSSMV